jgi:8-oxo-dGTP pyrophosphatase MutT (NUDIX family)
MKKDNPINPRPASTFILIRDHEEKLQTYLLQRSTKSSFFPGYNVFPGGVVDKSDMDLGFWINHTDMDIEQITSRFGGNISGEDILPYCVAGVRETFEEAGVLLAGDPNDPVPDNVCENRLGEGLEKGWLKELIVSRKMKLNFSSLSSWAHWITPKLMKYHFDTRFFLAIPPSGQECVPDQKEMKHGRWITPKEALDANLAGEIPLSPPTIVTLQELLKYTDMDSLRKEWETRTWGETRWPTMLASEGGPILLQPWDPQIDQLTSIDTKGFEELVLPPGEPFSRLYLHNGIWKPVRVN